jgi:hypothetical protein
MFTTWIQWGLQIKIYSGDDNKDKDTKYLYTVMLSLEGS